MRGRKCIVCGSATEIIHHPKIAAYHFCMECEFVFKERKNYLSREEELEIYNNHNNSIHDPRYVAFFKKFLSHAVFPFVNGGKEGFDFGSGPSPVLSMILERDYGYRMKIYDLFFAPETNYRGQRYDLITATEVVEHLADPIPVFRELKGLLKEGGILAVMTLLRQGGKEDFINWHYIRDYSHISFYTVNTLKQIAETVGLELTYTDGHRYATFRHKEEREMNKLHRKRNEE